MTDLLGRVARAIEREFYACVDEGPPKGDGFVRVAKAAIHAMNLHTPTRRNEEAEELLPFFADEWEPLRVVAERANLGKSPQQLASRARLLAARGQIESRWVGHYSIKEYRRARAQQLGK